ncbi:bifunctional tRNA (5-methylaminomethyl-2-thiouridine)(34)-methyltransferase MnmD/FAD-dependent 5-carboxymethylaminomethyl-2-thiouridine(34) oxidoreductase MnmC [Cupriavidus sp. CV2]|uniref:bifunctional tRNA (5-methylaminomethyl-2-thiouridine)(34)-methyltransferase MnmD/FAD-dependent 5-carboxymethylaminomethyl-2-thiouridine(34) oxidoreductase MnmC n=1 Tax=Cupriavidus ulmosensis TaxID=3065913 RepID=UPI00296AE8F6|nr:bifunctional tRNA (5-methylaminomethyl-2-thiouridine)(34)-methyltransferase MnmD/FAD-dependent 5-carboxymethylaminomethyl-2-thiouridine(34) oxidoreductase MnmC [Cupriavidus sp. CV2]MDW3683293.1 bifunctional tRNA (5-methylaminomethyl-2-thiouridine)(34)-methyltransferase MnmD/FAD-dependent 5-carboxymethylaminomethyl-2-thiouridine(34) oxidoreductase MnmC [Cupriavidus sp. CV2]
MFRALEPAEPAFSASGSPYSPRYDEVYHGNADGLERARHVFLAGCGLPQAWGGREQFVILEAGFGLGLNFLATWQAWRDDPRRCRRLHFVSVEKHPFTSAGLAAMHASLDAQAALAPLAAELRAAWPLALPGLHRLEFEGGAVVLTLAFGDIDAVLPRLVLGADAFYLDGFSPARNPDMWQPQLMKRLARLARPEATLATHVADSAFQRGLQAAGFAVGSAPGSGGAPPMTVARFPVMRGTRRQPPPSAAAWPERHAIVIGAGLAGCAVTERLAVRGWRVTLFDAHEGPAQLTSAHRAAAMHPHLSSDDSVLSRLSRAGNLQSLRTWAALAAAGHAPGWQGCGVLQTGVGVEDAGIQQAALAALGFPEAFARWMSAEEAASRHGAPVPHGGLWFGQGGWAPPPEICRAQLARAAAAVTARYGSRVARLARVADGWQALDEAGAVLAAAPVVVVANAHEALRLLALRHMTIDRVRGQLTTLEPAELARLGEWPDCVVTGTGYLLPRAADGTARIGSSYEPDGQDAGALDERPEVHAENLARLAALLPALAGAAASLDPATLTGYVGVRSVSHNRLPLIGRVADEAQAARDAAALSGARLRDIPRLPGLYAALAYGSRGLTWAALGAELLASQIEGEPLPLELELAEAIDPARLLVRALRQGQVASGAGNAGGESGDVPAEPVPG